MHATCDVGNTVITSAAACDSNAGSPPIASTSADAATMATAWSSMPDAVTDLPADRAQDGALQAPQDAAPISSDPPATAAGSVPTVGGWPGTSAEALSTAAADTATSDQRADWAPSPPLVPASRRTAPRPSALFRHSTSAMPHAARVRHSQHHHAPAFGSHRLSAHPKIDSTLQHEEVSASASEDVAEVWCSNCAHNVSRRPATAGQIRSQTAFRQVVEEQSSRPQTAAAAGRAWHSVRYTALDPHLQDTDTQASASRYACRLAHFITASRFCTCPPHAGWLQVQMSQ